MTAAEKNSAADTGLKKMKEASEHMKKNISKFQQKMEETNAYMLAKIERSEMPNVACQLKKVWDQEIQEAKRKIDKQWHEKNQWFKDLPRREMENNIDSNPQITNQCQHPTNPTTKTQGRSYATVTKENVTQQKNIHNGVKENVQNTYQNNSQCRRQPYHNKTLT